MENHNNITGMLLQQIQTSMTDAFQMQHINAYHQLSPRSIDHLVEQEMKHIKSNYLNEEEHFVEQMIQENPIIVERRTPPAPRKCNVTPFSNSGSSDDQSPASAYTRDVTAEQRAESCRKSRINNKVKKAKIKYRHKYISNKLAQSTHVLGSLRDIIAQAEAQLLCNGYNQISLQKLRNTYGLDSRQQQYSNDHNRKLEILTRSMDMRP